MLTLSCSVAVGFNKLRELHYYSDVVCSMNNYYSLFPIKLTILHETPLPVVSLQSKPLIIDLEWVGLSFKKYNITINNKHITTLSWLSSVLLEIFYR